MVEYGKSVKSNFNILSQFSKIVPIKTASLRYAVCGCCLCIKNTNCYKFGLSLFLHTRPPSPPPPPALSAYSCARPREAVCALCPAQGCCLTDPPLCYKCGFVVAFLLYKRPEQAGTCGRNATNSEGTDSWNGSAEVFPYFVSPFCQLVLRSFQRFQRYFQRIRCLCHFFARILEKCTKKLFKSWM